LKLFSDDKLYNLRTFARPEALFLERARFDSEAVRPTIFRRLYKKAKLASLEHVQHCLICSRPLNGQVALQSFVERSLKLDAVPDAHVMMC
jgi:hypothetical protein